MAVGIDEGRNEYQGIQNVNTTGSYNVGDDEAVEKQDNTLTLRFIEKRNMIGILQEGNIELCCK